MDTAHISVIAAQLGLPKVPANWRGVDVVLPLLERIRAESGVVLVKLDGERTGPDDNGSYTAVVSGGQG